MVEQAVLGDALLEGAKEVFETMVFMNLEESSEFEPDEDGSALSGSIAFKGSMEGSLGICCSVSCAQAIAKNMLGIDATSKVNEEEACDAICEVANMVMGCFKSQVEDSVGNLKVSTPSIVRGRQFNNNSGDGASRILVKVNIADEYAAELSLLYRVSSE